MVIKIFTFVLIFSILFLVREFYFLIQSAVKQQNYKRGWLNTFFVGLSITYIITIIITGF